MIKILVFILSMLLLSDQINATCKESSLGTIYCSKYPSGGAEVNQFGTVVCGKGECKQNSFGTVYCSTIQGGGAAVSNMGSIKCLGGCEQASEWMCEQGR
jgi:hypothetical protein